MRNRVNERCCARVQFGTSWAKWPRKDGEMTEKSIDRRVNRTRSQLQRALLSLISEKSYESITVEEICEAADVGRSTFYAHYTGKDELKRSGIDDHLRRLLVKHQLGAKDRSGGAADRRFGFSLAMFEHARDHKELYRALAGNRGGTIALGSIRHLLSDFIRNELRLAEREDAADAIPREVAVQYAVGAYMALLTWWLDAGARIPPEKMDQMFQRMCAEGV